jgi:phage shock protein A
MDVAALALAERTKLVQQIQSLQDIFDGRQRQQDFLALNIQGLQNQLAALDTQISEFPADIATAVGVLVADEGASK